MFEGLSCLVYQVHVTAINQCSTKTTKNNHFFFLFGWLKQSTSAVCRSDVTSASRSLILVLSYESETINDKVLLKSNH